MSDRLQEIKRKYIGFERAQGSKEDDLVWLVERVEALETVYEEVKGHFRDRCERVSDLVDARKAKERKYQALIDAAKAWYQNPNSLEARVAVKQALADVE